MKKVVSDEFLTIYMQKISGYKFLSRSDEIRLCGQIKSGSTSALNELIVTNLRFVISVARKYQNQGLDLNDLISEGNIGLIQAAQKFDSRKNFKFISYAVWWIRQSIIKAITDQSRTIRLPPQCVKKIDRIKKFQNKFEQCNSRSPTLEEISKGIRLKLNEVVDLMVMDSKIISLDQPVGDSSVIGDSICDLNGFDSVAQYISLRTKLDKILNILKARDRALVEMFFGWSDGVPKTLDYTARHFRITKEAVRGVINQSLMLLKKDCARPYILQKIKK